jgi:nucleoid-associated protein YgaU
MTMQKVQIYKVGQQQPVVDCAAQFNPEKLKLTKKASWKTEKTWKSNIGNTTFTGGDPISLSVDLFFDTTATGGDVRQYTDSLMGLTMVDVAEAQALEKAGSEDPKVKEAIKNQIRAKKNERDKAESEINEAQKKIDAYEDTTTFSTTSRAHRNWWRDYKLLPAKRKQEDLDEEIAALEEQLKPKKTTGRAIGSGGTPPKCKFVWGSFSFIAIMESVNVTFTMFLPNGTPVRARAKVKMKQVEEQALYAPQNPTSRSVPKRVWTVKEGQTLDWIAYKEYGDPAFWRHLAQINNLDNPRDLRPGQVLNL